VSVGEHEVWTAGGALIDVDAAEVDVDFQHSPVTRRRRPSVH